MTAEETQWLAGLLDGEGTWTRQSRNRRSPVLVLTMTDLDIVERAGALTGGNVLPCDVTRLKAEGWKPQWRVRIPLENIPTVTLAVSPWLSDRRRAKCVELGLKVAPRESDSWPWFAGLVEGEGSFGRQSSPSLRIEMTDRDVIARAAALVDGNVCPARASGANNQASWVVRTPVTRLRTDVIENIGPWLGVRRSAKCVELGLMSGAQ
jgi:hypothetical protein